MPPTHNPVLQPGITPREFGRLYRVNAGRAREWIKSGLLGAVNMATSGKPRYIILPRHLAEFEHRRNAASPPKPLRRRRKLNQIDFYPG